MKPKSTYAAVQRQCGEISAKVWSAIQETHDERLARAGQQGNIWLTLPEIVKVSGVTVEQAQEAAIVLGMNGFVSRVFEDKVAA